MKIAISGSHGMIGSALVPAMTAGGHRVVRLQRGQRAPAPDTVGWDPASGQLDAPALEGIDAVVHLAGESIATHRWTAAKKARIRDSRVRGTRVVADALARLRRKPQVLVCASAIGYYGNRGEEILVEESGPGVGFFPDVVREWEAAAAPAGEAGVRVVHLRSGLVLSRGAGALAALVPVFHLGMGGRLGSGRQFMSWITLDDEVAAIMHTLTHDDIRGPVNLVSPHPVTNADFTATLGRVLRRPTPFAMPAGILRIVLGEIAGELLASQRVHPARLLATGFAFKHPELELGLRDLLEPPAATPRGAPA